MILEDIECPDCDGSGHDECGCCGHEIDCETCQGEGYIENEEEDPDDDDEVI